MPADVRDLRASHDGRWIALAGKSYDVLSGKPRSRIALFDTKNRKLTMLEGDRDAIAPRWSPTENRLAFLSDRAAHGRFGLYLYDPGGRAVREISQFDASAEALSWAPEGNRILVQTAQSGAERAGAQGSGIVDFQQERLPDWLPDIEEAIPTDAWRRLWICAVQTGTVQPVELSGWNVWEAEWCGDEGIIAVVSDNPREAAWFDAVLAYVHLADAACEIIYRPAYQIGLPAATHDGRYAAIVEACCSDRTLVAGDVVLFDRHADWNTRRVDTDDVDVTFLCVRKANHITFTGIRGFEVAAGEIDAATGSASVVCSTKGSWLRGYPAAAPSGEADYLTVSHAYNSAPALVRFEAKTSTFMTLHAFAHAKEIEGEPEARCTPREWNSKNGVKIQGYFTQPASAGPHPLVVMVHGGPVWAYTNAWRYFAPLTAILVDRGFAVLLPNPRGSSGRGQMFARMILGDVGGTESDDIIAGVEALIAQGLVHADKVAIMGASHGGYMAAWLATQSRMFASAICAFPVTSLFSGLFTGTPTEALPQFLKSDPFDTGGRHFSRSPIMFVGTVQVPVLIVAGAHDHCVGVTQGLEFHRALVQNGKMSELVTYPQEGHGIACFEAFADYCTRVVHWLESTIQAQRAASPAAANPN